MDLLSATAANHRAFFRRCGATVEHLGALDVLVGGGEGTLAFPRTRSARRLDEALALGLRSMACWSLREDPVLGTRLAARGFEWGWQPHWMALDLAQMPDDAPREDVRETRAALTARDVPYADANPVPAPMRQFAAFEGERVVGRVVLNPWRGGAGIYSMGVAGDRRRRGIGRALTLAACRLGRDLGCTHALLNATGEGAALYRTLGFRSLGLGRTWWLHPGRRPTPRQTALVEAIGLGDLAALAPTDAELEEQIPGAGSPLAMALVTGRAAAAAWIFARRPDLVSRPIEPRGGTFLHCAVEWDAEPLVRVALEHGADTQARDHVWNATPLGWAEHLERPKLAALLRAQG